MSNINNQEVAMNDKTFSEFSCTAIKEIGDEAAASCSGGAPFSHMFSKSYTGGRNPDVILYRETGMNSELNNKTFNSPIGDGHWDFEGNNFNDVASSAVVVRGTWEFFADKDYQGYLGTLTPGIYPDLAQAGIPHDQVSSIKRVH
ncbi:MAG TPA: hypothetical protein DDW76_18280 [Cyanobacteria bacterium UBA11369]|nr:hypothetical protein [Cyanobacteria bacterium UBA8553]HAZ43510.1 hypothetical protein [Cyanobacteria bacterium UBA11371]HBE31151.1 hypothetical protein [Cyanobacteria bacterium UBA11368]HBE50662.1 hypothetical protein [Cyanobacteria bacterium UBA11369]